MDLGIKDRVALVTGGARSLGKADCLALAAEGCRIVAPAAGEVQAADGGAASQGGIETVATPLAADSWLPRWARTVNG